MFFLLFLLSALSLSTRQPPQGHMVTFHSYPYSVRYDDAIYKTGQRKKTTFRARCEKKHFSVLFGQRRLEDEPSIQAD